MRESLGWGKETRKKEQERIGSIRERQGEGLNPVATEKARGCSLAEKRERVKGGLEGGKRFRVTQKNYHIKDTGHVPSNKKKKKTGNRGDQKERRTMSKNFVEKYPGHCGLKQKKLSDGQVKRRNELGEGWSGTGRRETQGMGIFQGFPSSFSSRTAPGRGGKKKNLLRACWTVLPFNRNRG